MRPARHADSTSAPERPVASLTYFASRRGRVTPRLQRNLRRVPTLTRARARLVVTKQPAHSSHRVTPLGTYCFSAFARRYCVE